MLKKTVEIVNREHWLNEAAEEIKPIIEEVTGIQMPPFRISCGWPSKGGLSVKRRTIGQCWDGYVSKSGHAELFISPVIGDELEVAGTIAHELIHANIGTKHGHRAPFVRVMRAIGLTGKPTATVPGQQFKEFADPILKKLGPYPHAQLVPNPNIKVQSTRLLKVVCPKSGYVIRVTRKWLDTTGAPLCPCHKEPMVEAN